MFVLPFWDYVRTQIDLACILKHLFKPGWHRHDTFDFDDCCWFTCMRILWVCCLGMVCVSTFIQDEPREIIKPVPISQPATSTTLAKPSSQSSPAYNKTARPFGGGSSSSNTVTASSSLAAPKVASIPSESSAFTPAAPSQPPQPPFPLKSNLTAPDPAPVSSSQVPKPSPVHSTFTSPAASSSSSKSSSPAKVTTPSSHPSVPQPSVYNTPIKLYSNANACEVVMGQRRGLLESQGLPEQFNG